MRTHLGKIPFLFILAFFGAALYAEEKDYYALLGDMHDEKAVLDFVGREIKDLGGKPETSDFSDFSGGHSFSYIIRAALPGLLPDTLIIAAPALSAGSGYNSGLALTLFRQSLAAKPPVSLIFLFLGGDGKTGFSPEDDSFFPRERALGTRLFLDSFFSEHPAAVLYLNFTGPPDKISCETGTRGIVAPSWMLTTASIAAGEAGVPFGIASNKNQMYRLRLAQGKSPAGEYLAAGIPAISLENGEGDGTAVSADGFCAFFKCYMEKVSGGIPADWDRLYFIFPFGKGLTILDEFFFIVLFLAIIGISLIFALVGHAHMRRYVKTFLRNFWNLPLILILSSLAFMAGTFLVRAVSALRNSPELWTHHPLVFFLAKASTAGFLIILVFHYLRGLPFAKNGSFYSASAIFFFLANVIVFTFIDIAFSFYFMWAYCAAVVFSMVRTRVLKYILLAASPIPFYFLIYNTFMAADKSLAGALVNSPILGNFLLGFIFYPFFLMFIRIDLLSRHIHRHRSGRAFEVLMGVCGVLAVLACAYTLSFNPWKDTRQPLSLEEYRDDSAGVRQLRLASPSPLGDFTMIFGDSSFPVSTGERDYSIALPGLGPSIQAVEVSDFLSRRTYSITLKPPLRPKKIGLTLSSDAAIVVYDANFPYSIDAAGRSAEVFIGEDPPLPLTIILTFPREEKVKARLTFWSPLVSSYPAEPEGKPFDIFRYSKTVESFILRNND